MAVRVKFTLTMREGVEVRDLDELRQFFDPDRTLEYFRNGKLVEWLQDRYYEDEADAISSIGEHDPNLEQKVCEALGVRYEDHYDAHFIERTREKRMILQQRTDNALIVDNARITALDQQDLADLLDLNVPVIYLCGEDFTVPIRVENKKYIGILSRPRIKIRAESEKDLAAKKIEFENCVMPWEFASAQSEGEGKMENGVYERSTVISNLAGIHARPAALLIKNAASFKSKMYFRARDKTIEATDMLMLMTLGLINGTPVTVIADGPDAKEAVDAIIAIIDAKFGEE